MIQTLPMGVPDPSLRVGIEDVFYGRRHPFASVSSRHSSRATVAITGRPNWIVRTPSVPSDPPPKMTSITTGAEDTITLTLPIGYNRHTGIRGRRALRPTAFLLDMRFGAQYNVGCIQHVMLNPCGPGPGHWLQVVIYAVYRSYQGKSMALTADACMIKQSDLSELKSTVRHVLAERRSAVNHVSSAQETS